MASQRRVVGRPGQITVRDIEEAGRAIGLEGLTVQGVATALGVTPTALYRHVDGRFGLENLVGESLLAELVVVDQLEHDAADHLLSFAEQLRNFVLDHPGMSSYLQVLFPRGKAGAALLEGEITSLTRRGYEPDAAAVVCGTVALLAISLAAAEENQRKGIASAPGFQDQRSASQRLLKTEGVLAAAHADLPEIGNDAYFRLVISACLHGIVSTAPPGRTVAEITAKLMSPAPADLTPPAAKAAKAAKATKAMKAATAAEEER
ncbi:TetR/AcrR family transcriptional regulator [Streptosporangium algeriense]|uniref:TetR/AcrR family transcriptional regulator n=1 Tax=Streptosporangium algeriense TaxID=1682748 RepID=A0ABW3DL44_9ACTN